MSATGDSLSRNQSLIRGVSLLQALAKHPGGATVPELAEATQLPRTTAARLLATMHELGVVERPDRRLWILGPEVARIGRVADPFHGLRGRGHDTAQKLSHELQESAMIAVVYDNWEMEAILQVDAPNLVGATNWLGERQGGAAHAAASGKLALAQLGDDEVRSYSGGLPAFTPETITDTDALVAEIGRTRDQGWATTIDELELGLTAVAVPINDGTVLVGAGARALSLSLSGPSARLTRERIPEVAERLIVAARELETGQR